MELNEKPLGSGSQPLVAGQKQTPISQEVVAARLCDLSANMENVVANTKTMVKQMADSVPVQNDMLSQMAKAAEDNEVLASKMDELIEVSKKALEIQSTVVTKLDDMTSAVAKLVDRIGTMLDATDKNMVTLSMNTAAIIASSTTPREDGESLKDWRMRIYVETLAMFDIAEAQRKSTKES